MTLKEQIEAYKKLYPNREHTFKNGVKCQRLHYFLDTMYNDAVKEYKTHRTENNADHLKKLLK